MMSSREKERGRPVWFESFFLSFLGVFKFGADCFASKMFYLFRFHEKSLRVNFVQGETNNFSVVLFRDWKIPEKKNNKKKIS